MDDSSLRQALALAIGVVVGFVSKSLMERAFGPSQPRVALRLEDLDLDEDQNGGPAFQAGPSSSFMNEEHKLVLCVRTDLKMQKGKIAAQVGHATLGAYQAARKRNPRAVQHWERNAQPKIAVQIRSHAEARSLDAEARKRQLVTYMVHDAGRTQIAAVG